jgi:hypothetical protein
VWAQQGSIARTTTKTGLIEVPGPQPNSLANQILIGFFEMSNGSSQEYNELVESNTCKKH